LARAYRMEGKYSEAAAALDRVAHNTPDKLVEDAQMERIRIAFEQERNEEAAELLDKFLDRDVPPALGAEAHWQRGWLHSGAGNEERAIDVWSHGIERYPPQKALYSQRAYFTMIRLNWGATRQRGPGVLRERAGLAQRPTDGPERSAIRSRPRPLWALFGRACPRPAGEGVRRSAGENLHFDGFRARLYSWGRRVGGRVAPSAIGPYRVVDILGVGGMGEVYLAHDPRLKRKVALKRVIEARPETPDAKERLLKEARAAANLNHPNIAVVYDVIEHDGEPFIVMEYVEGETLRERLKRGPLTDEEVLDIATQITSALSEAHSHGIVHRDLKPSNILIGAAGRVKILDFGLAKTPLSDEDPATTTGRVVGTPAYMAPEQLLGYHTDHRSDLYSLGLVLFELLTGRRPFNREKEFVTLESMKSRVPRAPDPLGEPIARAMLWDPSDRFQSAAEMGNALERAARAQEDTPTRFRAPRPGNGSLTPRPRRRFVPLIPVAILLGGLLLVSLARTLFRTRASYGGDPAVVAVLPLENVSGDPSIDHIGFGIAHTLITKLSALPSITIVSRTAAREYGATSRDTRELARDLGAAFVIKGSVQRVGATLLITANLVRRDDSVAWGDEFEGGVDQLFELQRRLADGLTRALHLNLTPQQKRRLDEPPSANVSAYAEYSQGRYFLERSRDVEDLERGIRLLEGAVTRDPRFALAYAALGEAYWTRFEQTTDRIWTEKAREAAEQARRLDPDHPSIHYVLAVIDNGIGRSGEAMSALRRAIALQANYDDAHRLIGEILADQGDIDGAAAELRQAIAIRPDFWGHHYGLGLVNYRAGRLVEAVEAFERVNELQPDLPNGFQALGATYHTMGNLDRAVPNYQRALDLGPNAPSYNNLGTLYYRQGKFAEAVQTYEKALALEPSRPVTHRNLGDAYRRLGEEGKSEAAYSRAAELHRNLLAVNPRDARTMSSLALMEAKLGNFEEAVRLAEEAAVLAPSEAAVSFDKAVVQALAGHPRNAIETLGEAIEQGYGISEIREDDDLDSLREIPEFQALLETPHVPRR